jgi:glycosyltransferase involved in cell wall biosynthesis
VEVIVIGLSRGGTLADDFRRFGCRTYEIERRHAFDAKRLVELIRIFRQEKPHVVFAEMYDAGAYARVAARITRVPAVIQTIRSAYRELRLRYRFIESVLRHITHAYVVNADAIKDRAVRTHGLDPDIVHVIYNLIDHTMPATRSRDTVRAELSLADDESAIALVASFSPEKNHPLFLDFARQLRQREPRARFFLVGDGAERSRIESLIRKHGLESSVELLGMRGDVADLLRAMDLSVNCSHREGLCNALLESLLMDVPVLASRVGGTPELVTTGVHGELFDPGSVADMVAKAEMMLPRLDAYRSRIHDDQDAIRAMFDPDRVTEQELYLFMDVLTRRGVDVADPGLTLARGSS